MAQALYDEHPLEGYLKESGDRPERVPGAFTDCSDEESEDATEPCVDLPLSPSSLASALEALRQWTSTFPLMFPSPSDDFAERFKYDLISSNLLSSSVSPSPLMPSRSRVSSPDPRLPGELTNPQLDAVEKIDQERKSLSSAFVFVGLAALMNQHRVAALLALITSFSFAKASGAASVKRNYIPQVFESLENLKIAGSAWDAAVNDAIMIVEGEERSPYYTPSSSAPPTPLSALRVSLHSTLLTTQNQCDNVRPLLAALASPAELSQLSEMYAPPSPIKSSFSLQPRASTPSRKHLSENAILSSPSPRTPGFEKRQTWNGTNVSGNNAQTSSVLRKRERRRSDMMAFLNSQSPTRPASTLASPRSPALTNVPEVDEEEEEENSLFDISVDERDLPKDNFGTAALFLRRKRRTSGAEALGLSFSRSDPSLRNSAHLSLPPSISSSRFTSFTSSRNPLSVSALHNALYGALSSRRYACSHLLALRFNEDADDESYWENVRSVIALLISTFEDATARLNEALTEAENLSRQEGEPTPETSPATKLNSELFGLSPPRADSNSEHSSPSHSFKMSSPKLPINLQMLPTPSDGKSFAPTLDSVSRFASHVEAISSSLGDAKGRLLECVEGLQDAHRSTDPSPSSQETADARAEELVVLQSYDGLRRELGLALRECERGRVALLDIFAARRRQRQLLSDPIDEEEEEDDDTPLLGRASRHTSSGDSYDKGDMGPFTPEEGSPVIPALASLESVISARLQDGISQPLEQDLDDVTQHLLLTSSSSHLPPQGIEQVFESDSADTVEFTRERSRLSREERIRVMRAKRDSMSGRGLASQLEDDEGERVARIGWGPGTEVVAELKDVIWKVGERRRKMMKEVPRAVSAPIPSTPIPDSSSGPDDYDTDLCTS
ncbi:hypothetical protein M0805_003978 [Coniferiporia weirii]|nr:hypothetical protein M0805_003978 [Coniferiporia weirii]